MSDLAHFEESMTRTSVSNAIRTGSNDQTLTAISQATKRVAHLRDQVGFINNDTARLHEDYLKLLLDSETDEKVKIGLQGLLAELAEDYGFGWTDIARLLRVSVPAIRKWRRGGVISPGNLHSLAQLCAFLKILTSQYVADPAAWLTTPLSAEIDRSLTKASIYSRGNAIPLLAYVDHHINLEQLLQLVGVAPDDRKPTTELIPNEDGSLSIVPIGS
ncbi:hypothetical protein [Micromonospora sp. NPDC005174]|uniref:hypothetical protein n=1 Tax=Micromonospora sp. NPDC005174 TaxID=3157018 RepID=UPI0033ACF860